ncbi:hypothetical protein K523DRAFT_406277 [Schizophyllum commune Tattone D]|nr:hypothetical protein K523DRAFT_406277 [Schizophyllum commune Tattone D]
MYVIANPFADIYRISVCSPASVFTLKSSNTHSPPSLSPRDFLRFTTKKTMYTVLQLAHHRAERSHNPPGRLNARSPRASPNLPTFRWAGLGRGPPRSDPDICDAGLEHSTPFLGFSHAFRPPLPLHSYFAKSRSVPFYLLVLYYRTARRRLARACRAITPTPMICDDHLLSSRHRRRRRARLALPDARVEGSLLAVGPLCDRGGYFPGLPPLHYAPNALGGERRSGALHGLRRHSSADIFDLPRATQDDDEENLGALERPQRWWIIGISRAARGMRKLPQGNEMMEGGFVRREWEEGGVSARCRRRRARAPSANDAMGGGASPHPFVERGGGGGASLREGGAGGAREPPRRAKVEGLPSRVSSAGRGPFPLFSANLPSRLGRRRRARAP